MHIYIFDEIKKTPDLLIPFTILTYNSTMRTKSRKQNSRSYFFTKHQSKHCPEKPMSLIINVGFLVLKHAVCIPTRENIDTYFQHQQYIMLTHRYYKFTY